MKRRTLLRLLRRDDFVKAAHGVRWRRVQHGNRTARALSAEVPEYQPRGRGEVVFVTDSVALARDRIEGNGVLAG